MSSPKVDLPYRDSFPKATSCCSCDSDKAMISKEGAGLRIKKAALENDEEFFRRLSTALCKDPLKTKRRRLRLAAFLFFFWPLGFQELRPIERFN